MDEVAWYGDNSGRQTHDVGTKKPNQLGLYDCSGNVWEWCYDTNGSGYISEKTSYVYDESEKRRRMRGGSWNDYESYSEILYRNNMWPKSWSDNSFTYFGFRIVRTI